MTHTPGPWSREYVYMLLRYARKQLGPWDDFELAPGERAPDDEDADLIAAAPDLLAACIEAQRGKQWGQGGMDSDDLYQRGVANGWRECAATLRAAIAKAEGKDD